MSLDLRQREHADAAPATVEVDDLVAVLRPRLAGVVPEGDAARLVREAYAELGPVRVTTYLHILIERRVRQRVRDASSLVDRHEVPVTA
ncbi:MAG: three-helix bundle dimerization domain-containing protein [Actinomycetes bacterium]